ncbi:MAG: hypothetical protein L0Z54_03415 [Thermoplasmata archaeon]|nr:hypothetical protein [Thermoplasmata archaeon]
MTGDTISEGRRINTDIRGYVSKGKVVKIEGLTGQHNIAVGLSQGKTRISGVGGDYFGAYNAGGRLTLEGPCGRFAGDSMSGGEIIINGHVASGAGVYMSGGTLVVKGNAGDRIGINLKGGICVIDGYAGSFVGEYMQGGTIIITGNVGASLGQWMIGGEIYVGGTITNTGKNTTIAQASAEEVTAVAKFLSANGIQGVTTLRKIVPESTRPFFKAEELFADVDIEPEGEGGNERDASEDVIDVTTVEPSAAQDGQGSPGGTAIRVEEAPDENGNEQLDRTMDLEEKLAEIRSKREKLMASIKRSKEGR